MSEDIINKRIKELTKGGRKKVVPKKKRISRLKNKLDDLWSIAVKVRDSYKCQYCGKDSPLNSHHIYSRSKKSVRWDVDNGITLCVGHHTFSSSFSAHKTPTEFTDWYKDKVGEDFYNQLKIKANTIYKHNEEDLIQMKLDLTELIETKTLRFEST